MSYSLTSLTLKKIGLILGCGVGLILGCGEKFKGLGFVSD